jgi:hypothetical protein
MEGLKMELTITINGDNAAFYNEDETVNKDEYSNLLRCMANRVQSYDFINDNETNIIDVNGNKCGKMKLKV